LTGGGPKQPVGRVVVFNKMSGDFSFSNFTSAIRIKSSSELDFHFLHKYLFYSYLSGITEAMQNHSTGIRNLDLKLYKKIAIPLPTLPEQHRIVKILDVIFEQIAKAKENAEKNVRNLKELFETYLLRSFAYVGVHRQGIKLKDLGQITSSKRIYKKEDVNVGIPFYRIKEVKELAHNKEVSIELYISKKRYSEIKKRFGVPKPGDILMTAVGTIGEIYVVKNNGEFYFKDGNVLWFKNFNSVDSSFLRYILMSFVEQIKKLSRGTAYNALTIEKIEEHTLSIPPLTEQRSIVSRLDSLSAQIRKLESIYKQKLIALEELKKSILQKAFAGEL